MKTCRRCLESKPLDDFYSDRSKPSGLSNHCRECVKRYQRLRREAETPEQREQRRTYLREYARAKADERRARYAQMREQALAVYGPHCACCGESQPEFLTFDHIDGDGADHRRQDSTATSIVLWLARRNYPTDAGIQVLCFNCNCAKGIHGACPHERTRLRVA
jgi:hypothetical protein